MVKLNLPKARESKVYANPLKMAAAFLLDLFLMYFIVIDTFASYFVKNFPKDTGDFQSAYNYISAHPGVLMQTYYIIIIMMAIIWLYFSFMQYKYSQTIGMRFFGLYAESTVSKELTFWQAALRNIYFLPIFPIYLIWIISPIYVMFKGERLLEKISKTRTVEALKYGY